MTDSEQIDFLKSLNTNYLEIITALKNVIKSDEIQIKNLIKRNAELRDDLIEAARRRDMLKG